MTEEAFATLVSRLERESASRPGRYRWRVLLGALLGYAYVFGILVLALGLLGLFGWGIATGHGRVALLKLAIPVAGVVGLILQALWVRLDEPDGVPLDLKEHPALRDAIARVRRHVRAPRAHRVLLTDDFNAAVTQVPRLGILGWQKNFLLLGLPLMQALTPDQFEAVLAHEFGHLSGSHGKLGGWIYRVRQSWGRLTSRMEEEQHWGSFLFLPFFRWYSPWFAAYSFVLARQQEYEADRNGVELAGSGAMADALCNLVVRGDFLDRRYWPGVYEAADRVASPALSPHAAMSEALAERPQPESAQAALEAALARETSHSNTHPCLRDRLAALGEEPRVPGPTERSAAEALLGEALAELAQTLDRRWREQVEDQWKERYRHVQESLARLSQLDAAGEKEPLELDDAWERACLREELEGAEAALPLYQGLLERDPQHGGARYALGRILLGRGDGEGLHHIDRVMDDAEDAILPGCELAFDFLECEGRSDEAERYRERYLAHREKLDRAQAERDSLPLDGRYLPHGVEGEPLEELRAALASTPRVKRAWLVRRDVELYPERPLFVLGVQQKRKLYDQQKSDLALQEELAEKVPMPGESFFLVVNHRPRKQKRIFTDVEGSEIL